MKIGFVIPSNIYLNKAQAVMKEFPQHKAAYYLYNNYTEAPELLKNHQEELDAVLFGGAGPMEYSADRLLQKTIWSAIPKSGSALLRALMEAEQRKWDLSRISFDSYSQEFLKEVYGEIEYADSVDFFTTGVLFHENCQNETSLEFHLNKYKNKRVDGCITVLSTVYQKLKQLKVPTILAFPTKNVIRQQIRFVEQLYQSRPSSAEHVAICLVEIHLPAAYSVAGHSDYQFMLDRSKIMKQVYRFTEQIKGAVMEISPREFVITSTRKAIEAATEHHNHWELLNWMCRDNLQTLSLGIGYGNYAATAKDYANQAFLCALKHKKNTAFISDGELLLGPFWGKKNVVEPAHDGSVAPDAEEKFSKIAEITALSVNTVYKLYAFAQTCQKRSFVPQELAAYLNISKRSADRILEKLESKHYAQITGRRMNKSGGRPVRLIRLDFSTVSENTDQNLE